MAAEDLVVLLPEPPLHLQPDLRTRAVWRRLRRRHRLRRQVDVECAQDRQRQARHAVIGRDFRHRTSLQILVGDLHAVGRLVDRDNLDAVRDLVPELAREPFRELIHAADRLEHRRHAGAIHHGSNPVGEAGLQERLEVVRVAGSASRVLLVCVIRGVEVALADEEGDEALLVRGRQRHVERVLVDGFRHQLAGVAHHVGLHLTQPDLLRGQWSEVVALVVEVRRLVLVDEDLDGHAELLAVAEDAGVPVREAPRTAVVIETLVEVADLRFAAGSDLGVRRSAPQRPVHAAYAITRLENADVVSQLAELVAHRHPRNARAQDDHFRPVRSAREHGTRSRLRRHQLPRPHRAHDERRPADQAELFQERATGESARARAS